MKKKVLHIITGLGSGGAEGMLYKVLKNPSDRNIYHEVVSLKDAGVYGTKIMDLGINVHCLNINRNNFLINLFQLVKMSKSFDVIDTWLYHADFIGLIVGKLFSNKKLIWNIRHSNLDKNVNKKSTLKVVKINSKLSRFVDIITYNSNKAKIVHEQNNYSGKYSMQIPNGFELSDFYFDSDSRESLRNDLVISDIMYVFITVGRWDAQKDYLTLLKSLKELNDTGYQDKYKLLMVGTNLDTKNIELENILSELELSKENVKLLGRKDNIYRYLSCADAYISSSVGESFSNSIGEAMACELNCIVTDVGDSAIIVGDTGVVIQPKDYYSLASQMSKFIDVPIQERNKDARTRVETKYNILDVAKKYEKNYTDTLGNR